MILFCFSGLPASAQIKTDTKIKNQSTDPASGIQANIFSFQDSIPYFNKITPIHLITTNKPIVSNKKLKPASKLKIRDFNLVPSSVNGTMTARHPYLNNLAYLEILKGTVLTGENKVDCTCDIGLTLIKLVLTATAGKDYMVTTVVSPRRVNSFDLSLSTGGFVHRTAITRNEEEIKIILSAESSGEIELWMQCTDPNTVKRPWTFHSLSV